MPKTFDPAGASAPPETDLVRALYDGLTDTDTKTLNAVPAIALEWTASEDHKIWTFKLRDDAKWSNGKPVTAKDFVLSWKRLAEMGEDVPHHGLLKNIVGMNSKNASRNRKVATAAPGSRPKTSPAKRDEKRLTDKDPIKPKTKDLDAPSTSKEPSTVAGKKNTAPTGSKTAADRSRKTTVIGVEAIGDYELLVTLVQSDKEFPKLVAHPVFRPVYDDGEEFEANKLNPQIVTNGAFSVVSVADDGVLLKRSEHYWNRARVKLERVRFVPSKDAESALTAYREGKVDAVTNAQFEPLALKLLTPYFDFRRITHSALNLYEFNRQKAPFNDRRVREALAISIERARLTEDEMDGATTPANKYLPFSTKAQKVTLAHNSRKARELLKTAGFADGQGFPKVRLVVNRNNIQQRIAKSVAKMWKKELNIETEVVVTELSEIEATRRNGDFDILRRGVVLPTSDETANMLAIFKPTKQENALKPKSKKIKSDSGKSEKSLDIPNDIAAESNKTRPDVDHSSSGDDGDRKISDEKSEELIIDVGEDEYILTEEDALIEVPGIPLYFPTSYSLVKPYVLGFDMNSLDAPSLKDVEIDRNWQPKTVKSES
jgi:oligopeptide transport system substrate-binding protein